MIGQGCGTKQVHAASSAASRVRSYSSIVIAREQDLNAVLDHRSSGSTLCAKHHTYSLLSDQGMWFGCVLVVLLRLAL